MLNTRKQQKEWTLEKMVKKNESNAEIKERRWDWWWWKAVRCKKLGKRCGAEAGKREEGEREVAQEDDAGPMSETEVEAEEEGLGTRSWGMKWRRVWTSRRKQRKKKEMGSRDNEEDSLKEMQHFKGLKKWWGRKLRKTRTTSRRSNRWKARMDKKEIRDGRERKWQKGKLEL